MAVQDSENPSHPGTRLSPGDAAFERLRQREALRSRDESASPPSAPESHPEVFIGPPAHPAAMAAATGASAGAAAAGPPVSESESLPPPAAAGVAPAKSATPMPAASNASGRNHAGMPVDPVAMAAAFGIEAATPASPDEAPAPIEAPTRTAASDIPDPAPAPAFVAPPASVRSLAVQAAAPPSPSVDTTAARLEATLLDQLKTPEETLPAPARMLPAEPLRLSQIVAEERRDLVGLPRRSTFAPDPMRQRTYVDLRDPAPVPEKAASDAPRGASI